MPSVLESIPEIVLATTISSKLSPPSPRHQVIFRKSDTFHELNREVVVVKKVTSCSTDVFVKESKMEKSDLLFDVKNNVLVGWFDWLCLKRLRRENRGTLKKSATFREFTG